MRRSYNIGTECYALITSTNDPDFLLPTKVIITDKCLTNSKYVYKVKIRDIYETDFKYLKDKLPNIRVSKSLKDIGIARSIFIKRGDVDKMQNMTELLTFLNDKQFYIEDNYLTMDKEGLKDLYIKFVKYLINYHYEKMFVISSRSFLGSSPIFENQKSLFLKRIEQIGFGDVFKKFDLKLMI